MCLVDVAEIHWLYVQALVVLGLAVALHLATLWWAEGEYSCHLATPEGWTLAAAASGTVLFRAPLDTSAFICFQF